MLGPNPAGSVDHDSWRSAARDGLDRKRENQRWVEGGRGKSASGVVGLRVERTTRVNEAEREERIGIARG